MPAKINIDKDFLYKEYIVNKKSSIDIAEKIGCAKRTILLSLREHNIPIRTIKEALHVSTKILSERKYLNILTKDFLEKEYLENKKTMFEIGEIVGCNTSIINNYLKMYNIPALSYKEANRYSGKIIPCEICGKEKYFAPWEQKYRNHFYCSQKCRYSGMSLFYSEENASNYQGGKIEVKCSWCQKILFKEKCQLNDTNRYYCSDECMSKYFSTYLIGENSPKFGTKSPRHSKTMTENNPMHRADIQKKSSISHKELFKNGYVHPLQGKTASLETRLKMSLAKGGNGVELTEHIYPGIFGRTLKRRIKNRDNHICQGCFKTEKQEIKDIGRKLAVHHIDYDKFNCVDSNLITTCLKCNNIANGTKELDRDYWFAYYSYLINEKYMTGAI